MICSTSYFLNFFIFISDVYLGSIDSSWLENRASHHLSSLVIIVSSEVYSPVYTICKQRMVITCCNQIDRIIKLNLNWNALYTFTSKCSFIITSKCKNTAISGQNYRMDTTTGNFVHRLIIQWIRDRLLTLLILNIFCIIIIVESKFLYLSQTEWFLGMRVSCWEPKLIRFSTSIYKELQIGWSEDGFDRNFRVHGYNSQGLIIK